MVDVTLRLDTTSKQRSRTSYRLSMLYDAPFSHNT